MFNVPFKVKDKVKCCLDQEQKGEWYEGVIVDIDTSRSRDTVFISIDRTDGLSGIGYNDTWMVQIFEWNISNLRKLETEWDEKTNYEHV